MSVLVMLYIIYRINEVFIHDNHISARKHIAFR